MNILPSISSIISPQKVKQIMESIDNSHNILITTHVSPDGDAIGSSLALYNYIKNTVTLWFSSDVPQDPYDKNDNISYNNPCE